MISTTSTTTNPTTLAATIAATIAPATTAARTDLASGFGQPLSVELITAPEAFTALRVEWAGLLADSDSDGLFLTWEWLHTWWKHLGADRSLHLLAVRAGPLLVGLAPLALRPTALRATPPLSCLVMLGSGTAGSDHLDLIARRGWEAGAARSLAASLHASGHPLALARLRGSLCFAQRVAAELEGLGWRWEQTDGEVCPFVPKPPGGFTAYQASLSSDRGAARDGAAPAAVVPDGGGFKRKLVALRKRFAVRFAAAANEDERRAWLAILIDLHQKRWRGRGHSEAFDSAAQIAFHEEFTALALARGWLRLFVLHLDDKPVAALYGLLYGPIFSFYQSGFDPAFGKQSVGVVTMGLSIEDAFSEGATEFDMLHGVEAYKFQWTRQVRTLSRLEASPPGARGAVHRGVAALARSARRAARRLVPRAQPGGADAPR